MNAVRVSPVVVVPVAVVPVAVVPVAVVPVAVTRGMVDKPPDRLRLGNRVGVQIRRVYPRLDCPVACRFGTIAAQQPGRLNRPVELHGGAVKLVTGHPVALVVQR